MPTDPLAIAEARAHSVRSVQTIFATLAAVGLALALTFHLLTPWDGLAPEDAAVVARAFLLLAVLDAGMMFVWERIFLRASWPRDGA